MKIKELLESISYLDFRGNPETTVSRVVPFNSANTDDEALMWLHESRRAELAGCFHGTIITAASGPAVNPDCNYILVENPRAAFQQILKIWFTPLRKKGIAPSAKIDPSAALGKDIFIGENVVVEENCSIGDDCSIGHNTVLRSNTVIGHHVVVGCNCTIGGNGFGYEKNEAGFYEQIPHIGGVVIKDHVEIGNNTCIDRGVLEQTLIGEHVKIDNLVHIAHGVQIGSNTLVIAHSMIGGSTEIGEGVWVAPGALLLNKIRIGDKAVIGMGAVVLKDVDPGDVIAGNPGKSLRK